MLMKRLFATALLAILFGQICLAEEDNCKKEQKLPFKYEVKLGYSGIPVVDILAYRNKRFGAIYNSPQLSDLYKDYYGASRLTGNFSLEFDINCKKWFSMSFMASVDFCTKAIYDGYSNEKSGALTWANVCVVPMARFTYLNRKYVRLYSAAGLGVQFLGIGKISEHHVLPCFQTTPIGVNFGNRVYGLAELGLGMVYCGAKIGIGYRF